jgi:hypothetical protein
MERFTSQPLENPAATGQPPFQRADIVFYGVDHSGPSFEARIYLNNPDADLDSSRDGESRYAGSFTVFGHNGCAGDAGHCRVPDGPKDPFDRRPPHGLTPQTKTVIATSAIREIAEETITVTVVPVRPGPDGAEVVDALGFERVAVISYS